MSLKTLTLRNHNRIAADPSRAGRPTNGEDFMLKYAAISIAALTASTAFAQAPQAAPAPAPAPAAQPAPNQAQVGVPGDAAAGSNAPAAATETDPNATAQAAPAAGAGAATTQNAQVAAVIEAGFPKYDADHDGKLSEAEFKQWISDLKTQEIASQGKPADPAAVTQYSAAALAAADKNRDSVVTKDELTSFLGG